MSELASHLGLPRDDVVEATLAGRAYSALSLHRPLDDKTGGDPVPFAATVGASTWTTSSKLRPVRPSPRWRLRSYPPAEVPRTRERPGEDGSGTDCITGGFGNQHRAGPRHRRHPAGYVWEND